LQKYDFFGIFNKTQKKFSTVFTQFPVSGRNKIASQRENYDIFKGTFNKLCNTDYTFNIVQTHKNRLDYFQVVSALTILKLKIIIGLFLTKNWYNNLHGKRIISPETTVYFLQIPASSDFLE